MNLAKELTQHVPLVVGITGHRNPDPSFIPRIIEDARSHIKQLLNQYPDSPIWILSALAEGCDRIIARVTIELRNEFPGRICLLCPLPISPKEYAEDWAGNTQAQEEFDLLLQQSDEWFTLPCEPIRPECYAHLGHYLARVSHILLACWDGINLEKPGGTDRVIDERLNGRSIHERFENSDLLQGDYFLPPAELLDEAETGPVLHIPCPREQSDSSLQLSNDPQWIFPSNSLENEWKDQWEHLNQFNSDIQKSKLSNSSGSDKSHGLMLYLQNISSYIAGSYQYKTHISMTFIGLLTGLAASVLLYAEEVSIPSTIWIPCYGIFALMAIAIGHWAKMNKAQEKHLDYRALSEGIRVQSAWKQAGLHTPASFFYLRKQRKSLAWVRSAIRVASIGSFTKNSEQLTVERLNQVHCNWIKDQKLYYESKVKHTASSHRQLIKNLGLRIKKAQLLKRTLLLGGGSAFALSWLGTYIPVIGLETPWHGTFVVLMTFLPALAVALDYYLNKQAWEAEFSQYQRMCRIFTRADAFFTEILKEEHPDKKLCAAVLLDLGKEALQEQGDWYQLHHERLFYKGVAVTAKGG